MKSLKRISKLINKLHTEADIESFFKELLTESEIETLSKRWQILNMLAQGSTQREIAKELQVSLCKVTRGAKILKNKNSVLAKYIKGDNNENNKQIQNN
jgi:TrpR family trp operon transcriptional repressor